MSEQPPPDGHPKKKRIIKKKIIKRIIKRRPKRNLKGAPEDSLPSGTPLSVSPGGPPQQKSRLLKRLKRQPPEGDRPPDEYKQTLEDVKVGEVYGPEPVLPGGAPTEPAQRPSQMLTPNGIELQQSDEVFVGGEALPEAQAGAPEALEQQPFVPDAPTVSDAAEVGNLSDLDAMGLEENLDATVVDEAPVDEFDITAEEEGDLLEDEKFDKYKNVDYDRAKKQDRRQQRKKRVREIRHKRRVANIPLIIIALLVFSGAGGYWYYQTYWLPRHKSADKQLLGNQQLQANTGGTKSISDKPPESPQERVKWFIRQSKFTEALEAAAGITREDNDVKPLLNTWKTFQSRKSSLEAADRTEEKLKDTLQKLLDDKQSEWETVITAWDRDINERKQSAENIYYVIEQIADQTQLPLKYDRKIYKEIRSELLDRVTNAQLALNSGNFKEALKIIGEADEWGPLAEKTKNIKDRAEAELLHRELAKLVLIGKFKEAELKLQEIRHKGGTGPWLDQTRAWLAYQQAMISAKDAMNTGKAQQSLEILENDAMKNLELVEKLGPEAGRKAIADELLAREKINIANLLEKVKAAVAAGKLKKQLGSLRNLAETASLAYASNDFNKAIEFCQKAINVRNDIDPDKLPDDLKRLFLEFKMLHSQGKRALENGDISGAFKFISEALEVAPPDQQESLRKEISGLRYKLMMQEVEEAISEDNRTDALAKAAELVDAYPDDKVARVKQGISGAIGFDAAEVRDKFEHVYLRVPPGEYEIAGHDGPALVFNLIYVASYEVTGEDFDNYISATGAPRPRPAGDYAETDRRLPLGNVTRETAGKYCDWLTEIHRKAGGRFEHAVFRLPTDDEWSVFAQGPDGLYYPWGKEWDRNRIANAERGDWMPFLPGAFPDDKSVYGVFDVAGSVSEWVTGRAPEQMTARGGSFMGNHKSCLLTNIEIPLSPARPNIGFRVIIEIKTSQYSEPAAFK